MDTIDRLRRKQQRCVMVFLSIEHYTEMLYPGHYEELAALERMIGFQISELLHAQRGDYRILGVRLFHGGEFCIFLQIPKTETFFDLNQRFKLFRDELEERLNESNMLQIGGRLTFGLGCYLFEKEPVSTPFAVSIGYNYLRAIAAKSIPDTFCISRMELMEILDKQRIDVLAQPIMDLRTGDIFGWEMLTRGPLNSPYYKPVDLFEIAYQSDLLGKLEMVVIKKAFREIAERSISEQVFINVTSLTLANKQFYAELIDYLSLFPSIQPSQIVFEITERYSIRDYRQMAAIMSKYRKHGFRFALDDAGAGYASLQSISELIPDMIKIDRSLIENIDQGKVKQSLLKALLQFAKDIKCEVIAEGIEREEEADVLLRHAVTKAQGYYFAKPAPLYHRNHNRLEFQEIKKKIQLRMAASNQLA